jgi:phosphoribosylformylglycinamidine synthase
MSVDCNPRWCWLDPRTGAMAAVAEAARNVACTGAKPLALTNCLNFGNPEKPEIMWEFVEAVQGMGVAAEALGIPVVSGNVSLYNETLGRAIYPTPTIAVVGVLEDWQQHAVSHFTKPGMSVVLLGENREELGGSSWLALRRGRECGLPPAVDLENELRLQRLLREGVAAGLVTTAHDISDGGLAVALAESAIMGPERIGVEIELSDGIRPDALLFGESTGRVIVATEDPGGLEGLAADCGVPVRRIGRTGGRRLVIGPPQGESWIDAELDRLHELWSNALPRRLEPPEGEEAA